MNPAHIANSDAPRIGDKYKCAESDATYLLVGTTDYLAYLIDLELGRSWTDGVPLEVEEFNWGLYESTFRAVCDGSIFTRVRENT